MKPVLATNISWVANAGLEGKALKVIHPEGGLAYRFDSEPAEPLVGMGQGAIRFWYMPMWVSAGAGFNPSESIQLWKNMARKNKLGPPQFLSTHPSGDSRIQDLVKQLPEALKLYNAARAAGRKPNCQR